MADHSLAFTGFFTRRTLRRRLLAYVLGLYDLLFFALAVFFACWVLAAPFPRRQQALVAWQRRRLPVLSAEHLMDHLRFFLSARAITLGVALFVSSWIANDTLTTGFQASIATLSSQADWELSRGGAGIEVEAVAVIEALPGVRAVAPLVRVSARRPKRQGASVLLLGVDPVRDPKLRDYGAHREVMKNAAQAWFERAESASVPAFALDIVTQRAWVGAWPQLQRFFPAEMARRGPALLRPAAMSKTTLAELGLAPGEARRFTLGGAEVELLPLEAPLPDALPLAPRGQAMAAMPVTLLLSLAGRGEQVDLLVLKAAEGHTATQMRAAALAVLERERIMGARTLPSVGLWGDFVISAGGATLPLSLVEKLEALPELDWAAPVAFETVAVGEGRALTLVGVDLARELPGVPDVRGEIARTLAASPALDAGQRSELAVLLRESLADPSWLDAWQALVSRLPDEWIARQDALARPLFVSEEFAAEHGVTEGETLALMTAHGALDFRIAGRVALQGASRMVSRDMAFTLLPVAQMAWARQRRCDRLDIALEPGADRKAVERLIRDALGESVLLRTPQAAAADLEKMVAGFRSVLAVSSILTLLVGMFFIANTIAMEVLERTKEVGILRSLGATQRQVRRMFLVEGALFGVIGALVGLVAGYALAWVVLEFLFDSIGTLVVVVRPDYPTVAPWVFALGAAIGIGTALGAAWLPARSAAALNPLEVLRANLYQAGLRATYIPAFVAGLALLGLSLSLVVYPDPAGAFAGQANMLLSTLGMALIAPQTFAWATFGWRKLAQRMLGFEARLAAETLMYHPLRTAMTVVVVGLSLGMVVGVDLTTKGLKDSLVRWMDVTFPADIVCTTTDQATNVASFNPLDQRFAGEIALDPEVAEVIGLRFARVPYQGETILIGAFDMAAYAKSAWINVTQGPGKEELLRRMLAQPVIAVSENFRRIHGPGLGDEVTLDTLDGPRRFPIVAVAEDYSWPKGFIIMERAFYREFWNDRLCDVFDVTARDPARIPELRARLEERFSGTGSLFIYEVGDYKGHLIDAIEQMYRLSYAQVVLAVVIGIFGIVVAVSISVMRRTRELGLLRAVGMTRRQVVRLVLWESLLLALFGGVLGVIAGQAAYFPANLIFQAEAGFTFAYIFPVGAAMLTILLALAAGLGASWWPSRFATNLSIPEAIGYE